MKKNITGKKIKNFVLILLAGLVLSTFILGVISPNKEIISLSTYKNKIDNDEISTVITTKYSEEAVAITKDGGRYTISPKYVDEDVLMSKGIEFKENLGVIGFAYYAYIGFTSFVKLVLMMLGVALILVILTVVVDTKEALNELPPISVGMPPQAGGQMRRNPAEASSQFEPIMSDVTFDDVKGIDEAEKDLKAIVESLKNPEKFEEMGARTHKGVMFYGPPGTGKTLTAKAIAGEAGLPFFSVNGSEFMQMYVGVGPERIRELYAEAAKHSPSIVFIDEIDSIGGKREGTGNSDEKDRTINQLLSQLDGFNTSGTVLTIAATNRLDLLDEALIRAGRFDKHIAIPLPDKKARQELLELHSRNKKVSKEINVDYLSEITIGFSGAEIESLLNEAAFLAVVNNKEEITMEEIEKAHFKQVMQGDVKEGQDLRPKEELELVAWHEAGHALLTKLLTQDKVNKVTILSSTSGAGGVTFRTPSDKAFSSKKDLENAIAVTYGGRIAEYLLLGDEEKITTGASNDIQQASRAIRRYITSYGMNDEFGLINPNELLGNHSISSDEKVLEEAKKLSKKIYNDGLKTLEENYDLLKEISETLLDNETLVDDELNEIIAKYYPEEAPEQLSMF